jgi:hypothetical protein
MARRRSHAAGSEHSDDGGLADVNSNKSLSLRETADTTKRVSAPPAQGDNSYKTDMARPFRISHRGGRGQDFDRSVSVR